MRTARSLPFAAFALLCGCFNDSSYTPHLSAVRGDGFTYSGFQVPTGSPGALVDGRFFQPGAKAFWNGTAVPTTFVSETLLHVDLTQDQTKAAGTVQVAAMNEGGLLSPAINATIVDAELASTSVSPAQVAPGSAGVDVTVHGAGFRADTRLLWNRTELPHTFTNSTTLTASVPASLLASPGQGVIQVSNCHPTPNTDCCDEPEPAILNIGASKVSAVQQGATDIAWDATRGLLYLANGTFSGPGTITPLDPRSGSLGATIPTNATARLSISDQDLFLYAAPYQGAAPLVRYALPGLTNPVVVTPGSNASVAAAMPGAPATVAVSAVGGGSTFIVDGTTARAKGLLDGLQQLVWGFDASTLYGTDGRNELLILRVDGTGVAIANVVIGNLGGGSLAYDRAARLLYTNAGQVLDEAGVSQTPFDARTGVPGGGCVSVLDGALGRAFFSCSEEFGLAVRAFDLASRQRLGVVLLSPTNRNFICPMVDSPSSITRFGADGLAVTTSNAVYLYSGALVH